jgi:transcriptional regulator with XRE-family HTH domain
VTAVAEMTETVPSTCSEFIRIHRKAKGITQEQLAKKCKVVEGAVQAWESGKYVPKAGNIPTVAKVLGVDVVTLATLVDQFEQNRPSKDEPVPTRTRRRRR